MFVFLFFFDVFERYVLIDACELTMFVRFDCADKMILVVALLGLWTFVCHVSHLPTVVALHLAQPILVFFFFTNIRLLRRSAIFRRMAHPATVATPCAQLFVCRMR